MSNYIKEAIARANLQDIREFLIHGVETCSYRNEPYEVWLKKECDPIFRRLKTLYPNEDKRYEAADLSRTLSAYQSVYTEMGIKTGLSQPCFCLPIHQRINFILPLNQPSRKLIKRHFARLNQLFTPNRFFPKSLKFFRNNRRLF